MLEKEQVCTKCNRTKPIEEFYKDKSKKGGHRHQCKDCIKIYNRSKKAREANRQFRESKKGKEWTKIYIESGKSKEAGRRYNNSSRGRENNKRYNKSEKGRESTERYRQSAKGKATIRRYSQSDIVKERVRNYKKSKQGKAAVRKSVVIRRTHKAQSGGTYTVTEWYNPCKFYDFCCLKCNDQLSFERLTVDHIKPISKGGSSYIWNLQPLCGKCNSSKHNKEIDYRKILPTWINRDGPILLQGTLF